MKPHDRATEQASRSPDDGASVAGTRHAPFTHARSAAAVPLTVGAEDIAEFADKLDRALELHRRELESFDPGI